MKPDYEREGGIDRELDAPFLPGTLPEPVAVQEELI